MNIRKLLQQVDRHGQAGRIEEAVAICHQILASHPHSAETLHRLGMIARMAGQLDAAVDLFWQAIAAHPNLAAYHNDLGAALSDRDSLEDAAAAYRRAIQLQPNYSEALSNLGSVLRRLERPDEALEASRAAVQCKPDSAIAHYNLGNVFLSSFRYDEAAAAYSEALRIRPDYREAHHNLAIALRALDQEEAAAAAYAKVLALDPNSPETHLNLGNLKRAQGAPEEALAAYGRALELKPDMLEAHDGTALVLRALGRLEEAEAASIRALQISPDNPDARLNYGLLLLSRGDLARGWQLYESRWEVSSWTTPKSNLPHPAWDGSPLDGKRICIYSEQGAGDVIQFIRYVPLVVARGGIVIVSCPLEMMPILRGFPGISGFITLGQVPPEFDLQVAMMSLPLLLGTTLENIPAEVPYLAVEPALRAAWRKRLARHRAPLKVGLVWAGNPKHKNDRFRSIRLEKFAPLFEVEDVEIFSLQKGRGTEEIETSGPIKDQLIDYTVHLTSYAETAALIAELDLVISVDTSVVHLAGAIARPVWTLVAMSPDWRWMYRRSDSPWYPTMRLFRQAEYRNWDPEIAAVRDELAVLAAARRGAAGGS